MSNLMFTLNSRFEFLAVAYDRHSFCVGVNKFNCIS